MRPSPDQQTLLQLASTYHLTDYREAFGRCFSATLALSDAACRAGIAVELVRWQVEGDRDFCDHWALACGKGMVIDPTRVQVDGNTGLLHAMSSYPSSYGNLRRYEPELLLPLMRSANIAQRDRMPVGFMWRSGFALVRHDVLCACRTGQWSKVFQGIKETAVLSWRTVIGALQHYWVLEPRKPGCMPYPR